MSVNLRIDNCQQCSHRGHKGGFGSIMYVPKCDKADRELPYTPVAQATRAGAVMVATQDDGIPDWCPLRKQEEEE